MGAGRDHPSNQHVFAAERTLKVTCGALARFLGFGPPIDAPIADLRPPAVVDAILADHCLHDERRDLLIKLYHQLHNGGAPRHASRYGNHLDK